MNSCATCEMLKPEDQFYKGIRKHCKDCWKAKVKANRESKVDYYRAFDQARGNDPKRVAMREAYAETDNGKERLADGKRAWRDRNPAKRAAHVKLNNAIRSGEIAKPANCSRCESTDRIHGHHPDYSKPLDVEWLCHRCHRAEHAKDDS